MSDGARQSPTASPPRRNGIVDAAYHLPGERIDLLPWAQRMRIDDALVARLLDNGCRYFHAAEGETDADLIVSATRALIARTGVAPSDIAFLIHTRTQTFSVPAAPHALLPEVCERLAMQPRLAFSVGQLACASVISALELADQLLDQYASARYALVVSADRVFGGAEHRLRQDAGIQSDGGSAMLVGRTGLRARFRDLLIRNHPRLHPGPSSPAMGRLIGTAAWAHTRHALQGAADRTGGFAALGGIFPTNADAPYWTVVARKLDIDPGLIYLDNVRERGHSCCADLAINLADVGFDRLSEGRPIVCFSQSNVGAYGSVTLDPVAA